MDNASNNKNKLKEFVKRVESNTNDALEDSLMDEDAKSENFNVDYTDIVKNSAKAKISKLPWLISIFLILIIAITLGFMFFKNNPKTLFTQTVDGLFSYLEDNIDENVYDVIDGNISLNYSFNGEDNLFSSLDGISLDIDYVKDNSSSQVYADVLVNDSLGEIPVSLFSNGSNTYVSLSNLSSKYIKMNSNLLSYFISGAETEVILKGVNQAIDKAVAEEKIYGSKEKINIDGKDLNTYMMRLIIDDKNRDRVLESFINTLKANDELTQVLAHMKNMKESDVKKAIENYLPRLKSRLKEYGKLEVILYIDAKSNEFVKMNMVSDIGTFDLTDVSDNRYTYSISNKKTSILENGEFSFTVNDSKTKYTVHFYYKKSLNNQVLAESDINLKYTSKKTDSFKNSEVIKDILNNEMSEIEKFDVYSKFLSDPQFSKFLPLIQKMV